jgi:hypothetical protein
LLPALAALLMVQAMQAAAQDIGYFGTNRLLFEPVGILSPPDSIGRGVIDYQGGDDPNSQWRATVRFSGLRANAGFVVMLKGRYGDNGSDDARALTPLCSFQTNDAGRGGCVW